MIAAAEVGDDGAQPERGRRPTRTRIARAIVVAAAASVVVGAAWRIYQSLTPNNWQARLIHGEPVVVRLICGIDTVADCKVSITVTYQKQASGWCENLKRSDQDEITKTHWCNANPELGTLSLFGVSHSFDRFGAVKSDGHLVGQLFLP